MFLTRTMFLFRTVFVNTTESSYESSPPTSMRTAWSVLAVVLLADVMDLVDATVANLAGPSIRAELGGSESTLQWVLAAYTVAFGLGLVTSGRLGDLLGRRRMFLVGLAGFTVASAACGLAPSVAWLIVARVLQGLFGSVMIPQGMALVTVAFPRDQLAKAFVPFGPVMGLAGVAGPILAGLLLKADIGDAGWRSIFLINVPLGLIAFLIAWRVLPRTAGEDSTARLDLVGVALLTVASASLMVPLVQGRELGWPMWCWVLLGVAAVAFLAFAWSERRSAHPVIEPTLFQRRGFVAGLVVVSGFFAALTGFTLTVNLLMQMGFHWSPLRSGLTLVPWALGTAVGSTLAGAVLAERLGRRTIQLGMGIALLGLGVLAWTLTREVTSLSLAPALALIGAGLGLVFVPIFSYVLGAVTDAEVGTGSGLLNAVQQFAGAIGVAVLGSLFFSAVERSGSFVDATRLVLWVTGGLLLVSIALVWLLPKTPKDDHG